MKYILYIPVFLLFFSSRADELRIDSIKKVLPGMEGKQKADLMASLVWELEHAGLYEEAIQFGLSGLRLCDSLKYVHGIGQFSNHLGAVYKNKGEFSKALEYLLRAEKIFTQEKDEHGLASMQLNLGNLYSSLGDSKKALLKYNQSLEYGRRTKDSVVMGVCLANIGTIHHNEMELADAEIFYRESLKIREGIHDTAGIATLYNNIGILYFDRGNYAEAEKYYNLYLTIARDARLRIDEVIGTMNLGEVMTYLGKFDEGIGLLEQGLQSAVTLGSKELEKSAYETLFNVWERKGNPEKAFLYAELLRALKDSILNTKNSKVLAEMEAKFDTEKKEQEISLLQQDNAIKDLQSSMTRDELLRKNTMKYGSIAAVILLLVMVLFILKSSVDQKKANALLDIRNKELEMQKNIIEQKNSLINDSIEYASIIQQTLFPSSEQLSSEFGKLRLQYTKSTGIGNYSYALERFGKTLVFFFVQSRLHGVSGSLHSLRVFHELRNLCARQATFEPAIVARFIEASGGKDIQLLTAFRTEHNGELHLVGNSVMLGINETSDVRHQTSDKRGEATALSLDGNAPFLVESREAGVQIQFG